MVEVEVGSGSGKGKGKWKGKESRVARVQITCAAKRRNSSEVSNGQLQIYCSECNYIFGSGIFVAARASASASCRAEWRRAERARRCVVGLAVF